LTTLSEKKSEKHTRWKTNTWSQYFTQYQQLLKKNITRECAVSQSLRVSPPPANHKAVSEVEQRASPPAANHKAGTYRNAVMDSWCRRYGSEAFSPRAKTRNQTFVFAVHNGT